MSYQDHAQYGGNSNNAAVTFSHPLVSASLGDLTLFVNPYDVVWDYGLNTANFPTYGGEVVQILSMFFDDMTISGEVRSYGDMERIYKWFLTYIQLAAQGNKGVGSFDMRPVIFSFPERGWVFQIYPRDLPGFKYSRDITVPSYTIKASVLEPDPGLEDAILSQGNVTLSGFDINIEPFGKATAGIGFHEVNPFSGPTDEIFHKPSESSQASTAFGDFFTKLIPAWMGGDFSSLENTSKPMLNLPGTNTHQKSGRKTK